MTLDTDDLRLIIQVVQEGSFSRAAAALSLAQPSVSTRIAAAETALGVRLFRRSRRGVTLTPAGEALLPYVTRSLSLLAEGVAAARSVGEMARLHLAATATLAPFVLAKVIPALAAEPLIVQCTERGHTPEVLQLVLDGGADLGFLLAGPVQSGLRLERLFRSSVVCVAAPTHPLARLSRVTLGDVAGQRLALHQWGPGFSELLSLLPEGAAPAVTRRVTVPAAVARDLAAEHGYIAFLPRLVVEQALARGVLTRVSVVGLPAWSWEVAVVYRHRTRQEPALAVALRHIHDLTW